MKWNEKALNSENETRHVLGISGGKDSAALAIYIKDQYAEISDKMEYFFTDTGAELQEVYDTLDKLEAYLGKEIIRLSSGKPFDYWLKMHNNYLPSPKQRWCTRMMKIKPFEDFVGNDSVMSYIGIRADENREGYISKRDTIKPIFPFIEDGIVKDDVFRILEESVGIPEYYEWRSRSGCYFCFFQRQDEWLGLKRRHPKLFEQAKKIEETISQRKFDWSNAKLLESGIGYTWNQKGTLDEIVENAEMKEKLGKSKTPKKPSARWQDTLKAEFEEEDDEEKACLICSL